MDKENKMKHIIKIDEEGDYFIDNIKINGEIFNQEKVDYRIINREEFIETLIDWIAESNRPSDKRLMIEDLKILINWEDKFIFSSISTNKYIRQDSYTPKSEFDEICEEILKLNEEYKE